MFDRHGRTIRDAPIIEMKGYKKVQKRTYTYYYLLIIFVVSILINCYIILC